MNLPVNTVGFRTLAGCLAIGATGGGCTLGSEGRPQSAPAHTAARRDNNAGDVWVAAYVTRRSLE